MGVIIKRILVVIVFIVLLVICTEEIWGPWFK